MFVSSSFCCFKPSEIIGPLQQYFEFGQFCQCPANIMVSLIFWRHGAVGPISPHFFVVEDPEMAISPSHGPCLVAWWQPESGEMFGFYMRWLYELMSPFCRLTIWTKIRRYKAADIMNWRWLAVWQRGSYNCPLGMALAHIFWLTKISKLPGWWFQTIFIFHNIWDNPW